MMLHPVVAMLIGIVVMMVLIIFTKMHAFPSLIISAILIAVLAMPFGDVTTLTQCVSTVTAGFGSTMTSIGVVIGFGCIMGIFLEKSGADYRWLPVGLWNRFKNFGMQIRGHITRMRIEAPPPG